MAQRSFAMKTLVLVLSLVAGTAVAQTPAPAPAPPSGAEPETVYSDAQQQQDQSLSHRTVESLLAPVEGLESQYSRWKRPVCFNVYGLAPAVKYVMERRMKEIAAQVGAPLDRDESCAPSVTIVFTTDPPATLESVAKVRPWLVPGLGMIRSRVREEQPIQAWYATGVRGSNGRMSLLYDGYDDEPQRIGTSVFNHLDSGIETEIASVLVVVNTKTIMGMPLGSLADHFALVSLAEANFSRKCKPIRTVANLMHKDCDPALTATEITPGDTAMLTGLYKTPDDRLQQVQKQRIMGNMRKSLADKFKGERH
jgi:hypothetical protein